MISHMIKTDAQFTRRFEQHILAFAKQYDLFPPEGGVILAVSGGVDSVALASVLAGLKIPFEILHFNHGTRKENSEEEAFIDKLALTLGVPCHIIRGSFSLTQKNFEQTARLWRKETYQAFQQQGKTIFTAHHLDDSFEWSLMQSGKQGSLEATLGIPVKGHLLSRPFLCVSKAHIIRYAKSQKLSWFEDSSNNNTAFERNYIRKKICVPFKEKYPQYLRHYVAQKNALAYRLGVHTLQSTDQLLEKKDVSGGMILSGSSLQQHKNIVKKWIIHFSAKKRGEIDAELDKLIAAHKNIQQELKGPRIKGPMNFSGGVEVHLCQDELLIIGPSEKAYYKKLDERLCESLQKFTQIPFSCTDAFPQLVIGKSPFIKKSNLLIHPLLPETCRYLKAIKIPYTFAPVLGAKVRQKIDHSAVILASSDLGL